MKHLLGTPPPRVDSSKGPNWAWSKSFAFSPFFGSQISGFPGPHISKVPAFQMSPESENPRYPSSQIYKFQISSGSWLLAAPAPVDELSVPNLRASTFKKGCGEFMLFVYNREGSGWNLRVPPAATAPVRHMDHCMVDHAALQHTKQQDLNQSCFGIPHSQNITFSFNSAMVAGEGSNCVKERRCVRGF